MSQQLRVAIAGGSGFVGRALTSALLSRGHRVTWISRSAARAAEVPVVTWDTLGALPGQDVVCNLSGELILNFSRRWDETFKREIYDSRVKTTKDLVQAILKAPSSQRPKAFVGTSAIGYFPPHPSKEFSENDERGDDYLAKICADVEAASLPLENEAVRRVVFRPGIILGRGGGAFQSMYIPFYLGVGGPFGSGNQPFPWIHLQDVVAAYVAAIENSSMKGIYNLTAPTKTSNLEFSRKLASAMWRPCLFFVPSLPLNLLLGPERAKMLLEGQQVIPKRLLEEGFRFTFDTPEKAVQELVRDGFRPALGWK